MRGSSLIRVQYDQLPGIELFQSLGAKILAIAFGLWMVREMYHLLTRGQCDFLTPILRIGLGFAILRGIPSIGTALGSGVEEFARALADENDLALLGRAFTHAVGMVHEQSWIETVTNAFSLRGLIALGSVGLYLAMVTLKVLVIDILWPICFGLTLVMCVLSVPLSLLPGMGGMTSTLKNLIGVALWPVVFQLLVGMMTASFSGLLEAVATIDLGSLFDQAVLEGEPAAAAGVLSNQLQTLMQFWAFSLAYCLMCLCTPMFANAVVRSAPVSGLLAEAVSRTASIISLGAGALASTKIGARVAANAGRTAAQGEASGAGGSTSSGPSEGHSSAPNAASGPSDRPGAHRGLDGRSYVQPREEGT